MVSAFCPISIYYGRGPAPTEDCGSLFRLEDLTTTMTRTRLGSYLVAGLVSIAFAAAQTPKPVRSPDVPYVPTTEKAVQEMLKLAKVQKSDVLYDLGCGDGRI